MNGQTSPFYVNWPFYKGGPFYAYSPFSCGSARLANWWAVPHNTGFPTRLPPLTHQKPMSTPQPASPADKSLRDASLPKVDLRDPWVATFLAWLVPGLGHLYQRRIGKGLLYMITILGIFSYGMWLGKGHVVYAAAVDPIGNFGKFKERWHYVCQAGIGLPAMTALIQTWRVERGRPPLGDFQRPPYGVAEAQLRWGNTPEARAKFDELRKAPDASGNLVLHEGELQLWQHELAFKWEVATVYTMMAGLLNVLAICDARWGPLFHIGQQDPNPQPDAPPSGDEK